MYIHSAIQTVVSQSCQKMGWIFNKRMVDVNIYKRTFWKLFLNLIGRQFAIRLDRLMLNFNKQTWAQWRKLWEGLRAAAPPPIQHDSEILGYDLVILRYFIIDTKPQTRRIHCACPHSKSQFPPLCGTIPLFQESLVRNHNQGCTYVPKYRSKCMMCQAIMVLQISIHRTLIIIMIYIYTGKNLISLHRSCYQSRSC